MRVIVCEHGLLQVRKKIRRNSVEAVHWKAILTINKAFLSQDYSITYRDDKIQPLNALTLSSYYQNFDELVALIRQRSRET